MQNESIYLDGRNNIHSSFLKEPITDKERHTHQLNLVSANLFKFLPEINFELHETIYKEIILHNRLSHFEQSHAETFDYVTYENLTTTCLQLMHERTCILSTFHFGTYRLFNTFLINNKIPYTIVIPKDILEKEGDTLRKIYSKNNSTDDSKFIEVESPALGLKMLRELKKGRSIFIYFDGYRGNGDIKNANRNKDEGNINFLTQTILARKGVAYLANTANVPLITALAYRKSLEDIRLHFFEPVYPDQNIDKDKFAHNTTQLIYNRFTPFLKQYPGQWESWLYLHKLIDSSSLEMSSLTKEKAEIEFSNCENFSLNPLNYGLFQINEDSFLFNKHSYTTHPIDSETYKILIKSSQCLIKKSELNSQLFKQLFENNVLVPHIEV